VGKDLPKGQLAQLAWPADTWYLPAAQLEHEAAPASVYLPPAQLVHAVDAMEPVLPLYMPAAQSSHTLTPSTKGWY